MNEKKNHVLNPNAIIRWRYLKYNEILSFHINNISNLSYVNIERVLFTAPVLQADHRF